MGFLRPITIIVVRICDTHSFSWASRQRDRMGQLSRQRMRRALRDPLLDLHPPLSLSISLSLSLFIPLSLRQSRRRPRGSSQTDGLTPSSFPAAFIPFGGGDHLVNGDVISLPSGDGEQFSAACPSEEEEVLSLIPRNSRSSLAGRVCRVVIIRAPPLPLYLSVCLYAWTRSTDLGEKSSRVLLCGGF